MFSWLPIALLIFLFMSPVVSEPTSPNDPFRAIALQVPKVPQPPICCLKPSTPLEPVDDEVLLSFEEWKTRQTAMQASSDAKAEGRNRSSFGGNTNSDNGSDPIPSLHDPSISLNPSKTEEATPEQRVEVSPHFRVPLTDRFNYASLDCSARVHTSHRSAKSPSSILSSKRDRYMLTPCDAKEKQFVAVELCDDIRIDTVQLANFEFFSGVFKDFSVSVAKTYTTDVDGWTHVGTYKAKNVRGVQSFHPPTSLRDFYRYIRIDFETHYGNEYFCPVSLLRVYGLTHLEQWKWDIWEAESRIKKAELQKDRKFPSPNGALPLDPIPTLTVVSPNASINAKTDSSSMAPMSVHSTVDQFPSDSGISPSLLPPVAQPQTTPSSSIETSLSIISYSNDPTLHVLDSSSSAPSPTSNVNVLSSVVNQSQASHTPISSLAPHSSHQSMHEHAINASTAVSSPSSLPQSGTSSIVAGPTSSSVAIAPSAVPPIARGVESIYSTIMNRLTAIESNHTLYTRYIDQQNSVIREVLNRLGEDVGRLEGISRAQTLMQQRSIDDWEMQRYQLEMEYHDLLSQIETLSEEIVLEKRLGIAQLCLLLAVLVFLGLTRGSRTEIEHGPARFNSTSAKDWGRRPFNLSSDWTHRFKGKKSIITGRSSSRSRERSRSRDLARLQPLSSKSSGPLHAHDENSHRKFTFPSRRSRKEPLEPLQLNSSTEEYYPHTGTVTTSRSRAASLRTTPSGRRTHYTVYNIATTPTHTRSFRLQRSDSQGGIYKSAKMWGRTAHLHEVRSAVPHSGGGSGQRTKRGSSERSKFDHDRARPPKALEFDSQDVFSVLHPISDIARRSTGKGDDGVENMTTAGKAGSQFPEEQGLLFKRDPSADDGDPWVDTDSVSSESAGTGEF